MLMEVKVVHVIACDDWPEKRVADEVRNGGPLTTTASHFFQQN
jgi:hypothetical protein